MSQPDFKLILANDLSREEEILELCRKTSDFVDGIKIGIISSLVPGVGIIGKIREIMGDKPILVDYKVADIGFRQKNGSFAGTNSKIVRILAEHGASYITVHAFTGPLSLLEAVATAHEYGCKVLTLPFMTHRGAGIFFKMPVDKNHLSESLKEVGMSDMISEAENCSNITEAIISIAEKIGVDGYIGPGNDPNTLKIMRNFTKREIWCPGFGRQSKFEMNLKDQFLAWAEAAGTPSRAIVGSLIYTASDPAATARKIKEDLDNAVRKASCQKN